METTFQANLGKTQEGCLLTEARCWARYNISTWTSYGPQLYTCHQFVLPSSVSNYYGTN